MLLRPIVGITVALLCGTAICQEQVNSVSGVPTDVLYHFFFTRVMFLQDQADKVKAQGLDDSTLRHLVLREANLTTQQESALNAIASDWRAQNALLLKSITVLASAGQRGATSPQLQALHAASSHLVLDHLNQLQVAFGAGNFCLLDLYVKRTTKVWGHGIAPSGN